MSQGQRDPSIKPSRYKAQTEMVTYSDHHRFVLQLFVSKPAVTLPEFLGDFNDFCIGHNIPEPTYAGYLSLQGMEQMVLEINEELIKYHSYLRIRKKQMVEEKNMVYWVLVNTIDTSLQDLLLDIDSVQQAGTKLSEERLNKCLASYATEYKLWQLELFKAILKLSQEKQEIEQRKDQADSIQPDTSKPIYVTTAEIQQLHRKLNKNSAVKLADIIHFLENLCRDKWLLQHATVSGRYALGVRSLVELETYLEELQTQHSEE